MGIDREQHLRSQCESIINWWMGGRIEQPFGGRASKCWEPRLLNMLTAVISYIISDIPSGYDLTLYFVKHFDQHFSVLLFIFYCCDTTVVVNGIIRAAVTGPILNYLLKIHLFLQEKCQGSKPIWSSILPLTIASILYSWSAVCFCWTLDCMLMKEQKIILDTWWSQECEWTWEIAEPP